MNFTIYGNQEDENGNPLGYHRTTQGSFWNKNSKRYYAWKQHVVEAYKWAGHPIATTEKAIKTGKPIDTGKAKVRMDIMIYFANDARSDPDNVFKGIADALFVNDKYVCGSFDYAITKVEPRVEVTIHT